MHSRQLIAALLSVLLLIGGPTQGLGGVASAEAGNTSVNVAGCAGMTQTKAGNSRMNRSEMSVDCDTSKQQNCRLAAPHCASASIYGITTRTTVPPIRATAHVDALPFWAVYQSPISDVLTPPPDALS